MKEEEFEKEVSRRAGLPRDRARVLIRATLDTLAYRLTAGEAHDVASQLPAPMKEWLIPGVPEAERFGVDEFIRRVSDRARVPPEEARRAVKPIGRPGKYAELNPVANPTGEIGQLRDEALPVVRVIVPPDRSGRVFEDDLDPGDLVFDGKLTPMLVWHERYPIGRGWRSGWVLRYDTDGQGSPDDYIVGLGLPDVDAAVAQAREYMRSVGYPLTGWPS